MRDPYQSQSGIIQLQTRRYYTVHKERQCSVMYSVMYKVLISLRVASMPFLQPTLQQLSSSDGMSAQLCNASAHSMFT